MSTTPAKEIVIDLDKLDTSEVLSENEYINGFKLEELKKIIVDTVKINTNYLDKISYDDEESILSKKAYEDIIIPIQQNPCFLIHGPRGSGKSTMLRNLRKALIAPKEDEDIPKIKLLADIDPTAFAHKESFFIYILAKIAEKLNNHLDINGLTNDHKSAICKKAISILHDMSNGLKMLHDTKEDFHKSADAAFFIEDSVRKSASSDKLRQKFHDILEKLCLLEHTKALLITIDDSDLNPQKCSEIFETVRNYMLSPRIIIVFAGDLTLYSQIIRGMMINHFNETSLKYDDSRKAHREELLNQLEDQYLLKLIPAKNRVYLSDFDELLHTYRNLNFLLKYQDLKIEINQYVKQCLGFLYPEDITSYIYHLLLKLPVRSLLQLLKSWIQTVPQNAGQILQEGKDEKITHESVIEDLTEGLKKLFNQTLIHNRINFSEIHKSKSDELFKEILLHIAVLGFLPGCSRLISTVGNQSEKLVSLYLNAEAVRYMSSYSGILSYFLFIYANIFYIKRMYNFDRSTEKELIRSKITDLYYTAHDFNSSERCPWHTAFFIQATEKETNNLFHYGYGVVRILNFEETAHTHPFNEFIQKLENEHPSYEEQQQLHDFIYAIYHSISVIATENGISYYFSIYSILRLIINILSAAQVEEDNFTTDTVRNILAMYPVFSSLRLRDTYNKEIVQEIVLDNKSFSGRLCECASKFAQYDSILFQQIYEWAKKYQKIKNFCYPTSIENTWSSFLVICEIGHNNISITNEKVGIGDLFAIYLQSIDKALTKSLWSNNLGGSMSACLTEFPLWKAIIDERDANSSVWKELNKIEVEQN